MSYTFIDEDSGIQEYQFDNGLKTLLVENPSAPVVTVLVVYKVGSRNEAVGHTGATHFLEHMLFKGTPQFNKKDGTLIAQVLSKIGANFNATTWLDRTTYFETVPAEELELALKIEADRMQYAFVHDKDRQSEMTVVRNELERDENEPDSIMFKHLFAHAFLAHPYHHPTIGWHSDVEGVPTQRLKQFYKEFYHPNNATLVIVGDIETESTLDLIEQHFGGIPPSKKDIPKMYTEEYPQEGERRFNIRRPGQLGMVQMAFHVPAQIHPDSYALDMLQGILSDGVSSRLHQALVETHMCIYAGAYNLMLKDPGLFVITSKMTSETTHKKVESALFKTIKDIQKKPPTDAEVQRVMNHTRAAFSYQRHGTSQLASMIGEFEATANWKYLVHYLENLEKVTPQDIQRVAKTYLIKDNVTVGYFVPEKNKAVETRSPEPSDVPQPKKTKRSASKKQKTVKKAQRHVLRNGIILITQENHLDHTIAIQGKLQAGMIFEPQHLPGLANMTAAMLKKGTQNYDKLSLADALSNLGSYVSFRVGLDHITFSVRCLSETLDQSLEICEEILRRPVFPENEFQKLKRKRIDELKQRLDSTDAMAYDNLYRQIYPPDHPHYQPTVEELIEASQRMTLEDVIGFYKDHYGTQDAMIAAVGDINTSRIKEFWAGQNWTQKITDLPQIPDVSIASQQKSVYFMEDKANVTIAMGHPSLLNRKHPDYFPAMIANHALGQSSLASRLGLKIRDEMGLTYGIYSYFTDIGRGSGPWLVSVTTHPQNVDLTIQATLKVIQDYIKEGISSKEFENAKSSLIGSYLVNLSTNPEIAYRWVQVEEYDLGMDYFKKRAKEIESVTQEQVNNAIKTYFKPQDFAYGIAGNYSQGAHA